MTTEYRTSNVGTFSIHQSWMSSDDRMWKLRKVFRHMIVFRCEFMFFNQCLEYQAHSPYFPAIGELELPPIYRIRIELNAMADIQSFEVVPGDTPDPIYHLMPDGSVRATSTFLDRRY